MCQGPVASANCGPLAADYALLVAVPSGLGHAKGRDVKFHYSIKDIVYSTIICGVGLGWLVSALKMQREYEAMLDWERSNACAFTFAVFDTPLQTPQVTEIEARFKKYLKINWRAPEGIGTYPNKEKRNDLLND
jgi:hypothetical protein